MRGTIPERGGRQRHGYQSQHYHKKVHGKTAPDNQAGFTKAPNLGYAIVDNIRNREDQQSGCYGNTKNLDNFSLKKIGCNQAYIEQNAQQHKRYRYFLFHTPVFYVVF